MNERIRELAEQAKMSANQGDHVDVKIMMEKFAELIVRECGNVAWKCGSEFIDNEIKKHFGVE